MPANRVLPNKFKAYQGRTFSLRKHKVIVGWNTGKSHWNEKQYILDRAEALGESVFVLDETNTRVCVTTASGGCIWIQKYYLHKELPSGLYKNLDNLSEAIATVLDLSRNLRENPLYLTQIQSTSSVDEIVLKLETVAQTLRVFADTEQLKIKGR